MIYGTYLAVRAGVEYRDDIAPDNVSVMKTFLYENVNAAVMDLEKRLSKTKTSPLRYAVMCHTIEDVGVQEQVVMLRSDTGTSFRKYKAKNPLYRLGTIKKKNVAMLNAKPSEHASMHKRMLMMLMLSNATNDVLGKYDLSDPCQEELYEFQREYFKEESDLNIGQCLSFCRNVFSYLGLGWITINFLEQGMSAYFALEHDKLRKKDPQDVDAAQNDEDKDDDDEDLDDEKKAHFIDVEALAGTPIQMAKLSLNIPVEWALNKALLLHEISHYCAFMLPFSIEFFIQREELDEDTFEAVFSSHGKVFSSIFAHLLSRFCYIEFNDVQKAMESHGVALYPLEKFSESQLYHFISEDFAH